MTPDEIIQMACNSFGGLIKKEERKNFLSFAKLVAEKEREACAKDAEWCIQNFIEQHIPARIRARGGE